MSNARGRNSPPGWALSKLLDALRHDAVLASALRQAAQQGTSTRERFTAVARLERTVRRTAATRLDLDQLAIDLSEHLCPTSAEATVTLAEALTPPASPPEGAPARSGEAPPQDTPIMNATTTLPLTARWSAGTDPSGAVAAPGSGATPPR